MNATTTPMTDKQREYIKSLMISERARIMQPKLMTLDARQQAIIDAQVAFWTTVISRVSTMELNSKSASAVIDSLRDPATFATKVMAAATSERGSIWIDAPFVTMHREHLMSAKGRWFHISANGITG